MLSHQTRRITNDRIYTSWLVQRDASSSNGPLGRPNASQSIKVLTSFSSQKGVFKTDLLQHCRHINSTYLRLLFAVIQSFIPTRNRRDSYVRCSEKTFPESSIDSVAYLNKRPPREHEYSETWTMGFAIGRSCSSPTTTLLERRLEGHRVTH